MDIVTLHFLSDDGKRFDGSFQFATSSWYHKPSILCCMAWFFQFEFNRRIAFATSTKYSCSQFTPKFCKTYPIHSFDKSDYKKDLPWFVLEFNDFAEDKEFVPVILKDIVDEIPF